MLVQNYDIIILLGVSEDGFLFRRRNRSHDGRPEKHLEKSPDQQLISHLVFSTELQGPLARLTIRGVGVSSSGQKTSVTNQGRETRRNEIDFIRLLFTNFSLLSYPGLSSIGFNDFNRFVRLGRCEAWNTERIVISGNEFISKPLKDSNFFVA